MYLLKASEMREADNYTINTLGIPGIVLMENAGIAAVDALNEAVPPEYPRKICILCGKGNNGGDGFVIARHLFLGGDEVNVYLLGEKKALSGDAETNMKIAEKLGIAVTETPGAEEWEKHSETLLRSEIIVDAILGTGITKPVEGLYKTVVNAINRTEAFILAVDIPTGLQTDDGGMMGAAVIADMTVTFAYPKISHMMPPAEHYCGEIIVADICIPPEAVKFEEGKRELLLDSKVKKILQPRNMTDHKGDFGHLLVIAGSMGKIGAATMTARSATLSGAGLVSIAAPASCVPVIQSTLTQEMAISLQDDNTGKFITKSIDTVLKTLEKKTAAALGPGMGTEPETSKFLDAFLNEVDLPTVIDADGLNILAENKTQMKIIKGRKVILTPHPGEFSRLTGISTKEIQEKRLELARRFAMEWGITLILKGYRSVVATPEGDIYISTTGNPGMASGGSGDVLTGIIGGLLAMGTDPIDAACYAVHAHGLAGDIAEEKQGEVSMNAGDIMSSISEAIQKIQSA